MNEHNGTLIIQLLNVFINAPRATQLMLLICVVVLTVLVLKFLQAVLPQLLKNLFETFCEKFLEIICREIRLGIRNSCGVERADYIVLLIVFLCVSAMTILSTCSKSLSTPMILICGMVGLTVVAILSVIIVSIDSRRVALIKEITDDLESCDV